MKTVRIVTLITTVIAIFMLSCTTKVYPTKPMPPGQAKKVYGHKSARHHAPGQHKK